MKFIPKLMLVAALLSGAVAGRAQVVFTFDGSETGPSFTKNVAGITMSASDSDGPSGNFGSESTSGLFISGDNTYGQTTFKLSFDTAVQITHYQVGDVFNASGSFNLARTSGLAGTPSTGNDLAAVGTFAINGTFTVLANQEITFTSDLDASEYSQIKSFTVMTVVPEPAETAALGAAFCALVAFAARRRLGRAGAV